MTPALRRHRSLRLSAVALCLFVWLGSLSGILPAMTAAFGGLSGEHRVSVAASDEGILIAFEHDHAPTGNHQHSLVTELLLLLQSPTADDNEDHRLDFRLAKARLEPPTRVDGKEPAGAPIALCQFSQFIRTGGLKISPTHPRMNADPPAIAPVACRRCTVMLL